MKTAKETVLEGRSKKANVSMKIPVRYQGKTLPSGKSYQQARVAILSGKSIFLTGVCGSGKTHTAIALMNEWFADGLKLEKEKIYQSKGQAIYLPAVELFLELKQSFDGRGDEKEILDKYTNIALLTIDDLGAEKISDWSRTILYLIIDRRYRNMKQTIVTSNLSLEDLSEKFDDRLASRLIEMGPIINLGKKDWRLQVSR